MSIEIALCSDQGEELQERQQILTFPSFLNLAKVLSWTAGNMRRKDASPETHHLQEAYVFYIEDNRERSIAQFDDYCRSMWESMESLVGQRDLEGVIDIRTGKRPVRSDPEDYNADIRALLGRLLLSDEAVDENEWQLTFDVLVWVGAILTRYINALSDEEHEFYEYLPGFEFCLSVFKQIAEYAELSKGSQRAFIFLA